MAERMLSPFSKGASHADCRVECPRLQVMAHCKLMAKSGPEAYRGPARRSQRALDRPNACAVPVAGTLRQCALEKKCFKRAVHLLRRRAVYSQAQVVPYYASAGALRQCALRVERSVSKGPYRFSEGEPSRQRRSPAPRSITAARGCRRFQSKTSHPECVNILRAPPKCLKQASERPKVCYTLFNGGTRVSQALLEAATSNSTRKWLPSTTPRREQALHVLQLRALGLREVRAHHEEGHAVQARKPRATPW